ncbi:hypothetical protein BH23BAC4_BH23BAC4_05540 [soil metagenome]
MSIASFRRRFDYHRWANLEVGELLTDDVAHQPARHLVNHLAEADLLWIARVEEVPHKHNLWDAPDAESCRRRLAAAARAIQRLLAKTDDEALSRSISYQNTSGEPFSTPLGEILDHLLLHGAHHRGQVALALRAAGTPPPRTDYIAWVRK